MACLLRPAVGSSMMPGAWLPMFPLPLSSGTAAAVVGDEDTSYWRRAAVCGAAVSSHLHSGRSSSLSTSPHRSHSESLAETSSRLLFCLLSWVSHVPSFNALAISDQVEPSLNTALQIARVLYLL